LKNVEHDRDARELALPPSVQEALGELVNAAKDGLLALSVGVGLGVLSEMLEAEVWEVVGPKNAKLPDRTARARRTPGVPAAFRADRSPSSAASPSGEWAMGAQRAAMAS
jgi:hypothetical protein